ncbi:MAG: hypothetical protein V4649_03235 [Bacteroidota bacterium]
MLLLTLISTPMPCLRAQPAASHVTNEEDDPFEAKTYFMAGLNFLSDNVYLGRKDTVTLPYLSPYIGYHHKSGAYAKMIASYSLAGQNKRFDLLTLQAAYEHTIGDNFYGGLSAEKYFYGKKTGNVRGNTRGSVEAYGQYLNEWVQPQVTIGANFNKKTDFVAGLSVEHDFKIAGGKGSVIPAVAVNAGTLHYYNEYFSRKDSALKQSALGNAGAFKLLDIEVSCKATYRASKWLFTFIPTYAIALNPATITLPAKTITEKLGNTFYLELDICYR